MRGNYRHIVESGADLPARGIWLSWKSISARRRTPLPVSAFLFDVACWSGYSV